MGAASAAALTGAPARGGGGGSGGGAGGAGAVWRVFQQVSEMIWLLLLMLLSGMTSLLFVLNLSYHRDQVVELVVPAQVQRIQEIPRVIFGGTTGETSRQHIVLLRGHRMSKWHSVRPVDQETITVLVGGHEALRRGNLDESRRTMSLALAQSCSFTQGSFGEKGFHFHHCNVAIRLIHRGSNDTGGRPVLWVVLEKVVTEELALDGQHCYRQIFLRIDKLQGGLDRREGAKRSCFIGRVFLHGQGDCELGASIIIREECNDGRQEERKLKTKNRVSNF